MSFVDIIIIVAAIAYAYGGYRNGAVVGAFSLAGFLGGSVVGAQLARPLGSHLLNGRSQVPVAIICVLIAAIAGQLIAVGIAGQLRRRIVWRPVKALDAGIGAALGVLSVLLVAWMVAVPLASSPYPTLVSAIDESVVVRHVDQVMPGPVRSVYSSLRNFIDRSGFPPVLGDLHSTHIVDVGPPDPAVLNSPAVVSARSSVLKIYSQAPSCNRGIEGSGFVYAPQHVLTNAHVVAGANSFSVQSSSTSSISLKATVVSFDPTRDVAVLYVPDLKAAPLRFAPAPAKTDDSAIVVGYPEDGPFDVRAARVRDREEVAGRDIYGSAVVNREIYAIRSTVRSGNSGGPLLTPSGSVLGMVFATALNSSDTGYALTDAEIGGDAAAASTARTSVATGHCT
jgi:S1-C subfamily serine protease